MPTREVAGRRRSPRSFWRTCARSGARGSGPSRERPLPGRGARLPDLRRHLLDRRRLSRRARHRRPGRARDAGRRGVDRSGAGLRGGRPVSPGASPGVVRALGALPPRLRANPHPVHDSAGVARPEGRPAAGNGDSVRALGRRDHIPRGRDRIPARHGDRARADRARGLGRGNRVKRYRDVAGDGGSNIAGQVEAQQGQLRKRLASVASVVAIVSGKGGVGKSALTANLACCLALDGWRVGVLDADLNGPTQAKILGVRGRRLVLADGGIEPPATALGVKVMSMDLLLAGDAAPLAWDSPVQEAHTWRGSMEANAVREFLADTNWGELDALLLDLPPGTDRLATVASLAPALHGIIVVTIPSEVSQLVVRRSVTAAAATKVPVLGLVENMAGLFPGPDASRLAADVGIPFLGTVPFDPALSVAADRGEAFV